MLELWQTEWCPASHRVREHLTELGVDYVARQVPVDTDARAALRDATGANVIPASASRRTHRRLADMMSRILHWFLGMPCRNGNG